MIKRIKSYWWQIRLFGWAFDIRFYPLKAKKEYRELAEQIVWARGKPEQIDLIAKRAKLAQKYGFV